MANTKGRTLSAEKPSQEHLKALGPDKAHLVKFHEHGQLEVTDSTGKRRRDLERAWPLLWADYVASLGVDPTAFTILAPGGKRISIVKQVDQLTWKIHE